MPSSELVQSLLRGLDILQAVGEAEDGLRLNDLSERLKLNATTIHNLARTLAARNFLEKQGPRYRLGPAVSELASLAGGRELLTWAEAALTQLAATLPKAVLTFSRLTGGEIVVTRRLSPDRPGLMQRPQQIFFHPYANASGLAALAFAAEDDLVFLRERYPFAAFGAHLWESEAKLAAALEEYRRLGLAELPFGREARLCAAAPLFTAAGQLRGFLGLNLPEPAPAGSPLSILLEAAGGYAAGYEVKR